MLSLFDFEQVVRDKFNTSPRGWESVFIKISDEIGAKIVLHPCGITHEQARDYIYNAQKLAAKHGIGPEVHGKFEISIEDKIYYGYLTEIVEIPEYRLGDDYHVKAHDSSIQETEEFAQLQDDLDNLGLSGASNDLYLGNIGYKDGKMICIDFGACNLSDTEI